MLPEYIKLKEIKPALGGFIREANSVLNPEIVPDEKTVHDVRVLMKKSRAVMKLLDSQVDESDFVREYKAFREVGREMSVWRETSVLRKILKEIKKKYPDIFIQLQDSEKLSSILKKSEVNGQAPPETKEKLENIKEILTKSAYRIRFQKMNNLDPQLLLKELEKTYIRVSECYLKARNNPKPPNLHEFRKKTKDFLYQVYFFRTLKPKAVKDLEKRLDTLAQNLGKYNDRAVLIKALGYQYNESGNNDALDELIIIIRNEQDRFLLKVWPEAFRIFCPGQKLTNLLGFKILTI